MNRAFYLIGVEIDVGVIAANQGRIAHPGRVCAALQDIPIKETRIGPLPPNMVNL